MTTFAPTEAELLERGFDKINCKIPYYIFYTESGNTIEYHINGLLKIVYLQIFELEDRYSYPTSFEDIDAIIRIFTPKQ